MTFPPIGSQPGEGLDQDQRDAVRDVRERVRREQELQRNPELRRRGFSFGQLFRIGRENIAREDARIAQVRQQQLNARRLDLQERQQEKELLLLEQQQDRHRREKHKFNLDVAATSLAHLQDRFERASPQERAGLLPLLREQENLFQNTLTSAQAIRSDAGREGRIEQQTRRELTGFQREDQPPPDAEPAAPAAAAAPAPRGGGPRRGPLTGAQRAAQAEVQAGAVEETTAPVKPEDTQTEHEKFLSGIAGSPVRADTLGDKPVNVVQDADALQRVQSDETTRGQNFITEEDFQARQRDVQTERSFRETQQQVQLRRESRLEREEEREARQAAVQERAIAGREAMIGITDAVRPVSQVSGSLVSFVSHDAQGNPTLRAGVPRLPLTLQPTDVDVETGDDGQQSTRVNNVNVRDFAQTLEETSDHIKRQITVDAARGNRIAVEENLNAAEAIAKTGRREAITFLNRTNGNNGEFEKLRNGSWRKNPFNPQQSQVTEMFRALNDVESLVPERIDERAVDNLLPNNNEITELFEGAAESFAKRKRSSMRFRPVGITGSFSRPIGEGSSELVAEANFLLDTLTAHLGVDEGATLSTIAADRLTNVLKSSARDLVTGPIRGSTNEQNRLNVLGIVQVLEASGVDRKDLQEIRKQIGLRRQ